MHQAIVDILNGAHWYGADIRGTQPWRLTLKGWPVDMALVATRSSDGWTLIVTDEMGRFDGPFVTGDDAGEVVEYFEQLIADVVEHDLLPAEALVEVDLSEIERLALAFDSPDGGWGPGEWKMR